MDHKQALARQILEQAQRMLAVVLEKQHVDAKTVDATRYDGLKEDSMRVVVPIGPDTLDIQVSLKSETAWPGGWKRLDSDTSPSRAVTCKRSDCINDVKDEGEYCAECEMDRAGGT